MTPAVWPAGYPEFGWATNPKMYPGKGYHGRWFHCAAGTLHDSARQQSIAFTHPYTPPLGHTAGFVSSPAAQELIRTGDFEALRIGAAGGTAPTRYLQQKAGEGQHSLLPPLALPIPNPKEQVVVYASPAEAWQALANGTVHMVYAEAQEARAWMAGYGSYLFLADQPLTGFAKGVAYGCHPEFGDKLSALNTGLAAFLATPAYADLCAKYPSIECNAPKEVNLLAGIACANVTELVSPQTFPGLSTYEVGPNHTVCDMLQGDPAMTGWATTSATPGFEVRLAAPAMVSKVVLFSSRNATATPDANPTYFQLEGRLLNGDWYELASGSVRFTQSVERFEQVLGRWESGHFDAYRITFSP